MMNHLPLRAAVLAQLAWMDVGSRMAESRTRASLDDERGEIGSWMILAAVLAAAAAYAATKIGPWIEGKADEVVTN